MIARDQRQAFVSAEFSNQRNELLRVGEFFSVKVDVERVQELRRIKRLILACDRDVEDEDGLITDAPVFVNQRFGIQIVRPVELRDALARIASLWEALRFLDSNDNYQSERQYPHLGTMRLKMT